MNPIFQFAGGFVGESEGNYIGGRNAQRFLFAKDIDDALGNNLGLAGTGAGNYLQVAVQVAECFPLVISILHAIPYRDSYAGISPSRAKL